VSPRQRGGAFVVDAVRTPYGRRGGALSAWHPVDLASQLLISLTARNRVEGAAVDDVVFGCTSQVGAQAANIARRAALAAGWPEHVPGVTVDRQAASSAQAVHWAAQAVISGAQALVVAGGVEAMTAVPLGAALGQPEVGKPYGQRLVHRYRGGGGLLPPGLVAEEVARRWSLSRGVLDAWALNSRDKAVRAQAALPSFFLPVGAGALDAGEDPVRRPGRPRPGSQLMLTKDEALNDALTAAAAASLAPAYLEGGVVTAANMAAEGDGASALLIASPRVAATLSLVPKARFVSFGTAGADPAIWPMAAVPAMWVALDRAGLSPADIDRWHVHESSAAAVLAWAAEMGADLQRVNPEGGALASTAPIGAVGAGMFAAAVAGLAESSERYAAVCVAGEGGVGTACVLERAS
jgi:acetyl-CoA acyltransferase